MHGQPTDPRSSADTVAPVSALVDPQRVVDGLLAYARPEILRYFAADSCIASTRIALDVLGYFGIHAKAVPVSVTVFNEDARAIYERDGIEEVARAVHAARHQDTGGPWTLGIGVDLPGKPPGPGHVVAVLPRQRLLLDLSLDQANRPKKNLLLGPLAVDIPEDSRFMEEPGEVLPFIGQMDESVPPVALIYRRERSHRYRESLNWQRKASAEGASEGFREITANVIAAIRGE